MPADKPNAASAAREAGSASTLASPFPRPGELEALIELAYDTIFIHNLSNRILYWNRAAEEMYGWTRDEALGHVAYELLQTVFPAPFEDIQRALQVTGRWEGELIHTRRDGTQLLVVSRWALHRGEAGEPDVIMEIVRDVTLRRAHEQEVERMNARLYRAMAETHHRVKNNLQAITAMVELQLPADGADVPVTALERIAQQISALAGVHDLLTDAAQRAVEAEEVPARKLFTGLIRTVQRAMPHRAIHLEAADTPLSSRAAASLVLSVSEMISNANKHAPSGDICVNFAVEGGTAFVEVADHGPGFSADFDPVRSANFGLDLIDQLVRWDLRGDVTYRNRPGGGAVVTITFPVGSVEKEL